ncbi:MAG: phage tail assembly protein [Abditibacteriota bacterium]|nr:phage tail assembly protein [Abditibacteriota bacterium]
MEKFTLSKPIKINGEERTEFEFDFDALDANHIPVAEKAATPEGNITPLSVTFGLYLAFLAIIEANPGVTLEDLKRMGARDSIKLAGKGYSFFNGSDDPGAQS